MALPAVGLPLNGVLLPAAGLAETFEAITGKTGGGNPEGSIFTGPPWGDDSAGQIQIKQGFAAACN